MLSIVSTITNRTGFCSNTFAATRTWRATDASGNHSDCFQIVTIADTTPPIIGCPQNKTLLTTNANGLTVSFSTTTSDSCDPNPALVCSPPAGSLFPIGTNTVQ